MQVPTLSRLFGIILTMATICSTFAVALPVSMDDVSMVLDDTSILAGLTIMSRASNGTDRELNLTAYPDAITELNKTFTAVVAIPDSILKEGNDATTTWLEQHGYRGGIHTKSFWQKTECALAIVAFLGSNLVAAAKILKIKEYIEALGGVVEAVELMLKCSTTEEMLREGGAILVNLAAEILGIPVVAKACS